MLTIISMIISFATQGLPEVLKWLQKRSDQKHELEMFKLQIASAEKQAAYRLDKTVAIATAQEQIGIRQSQPSFGVQLIDAATRSNWGIGSLIPAFYLFAFVDALNNSIRSVISYAIVGLYIACKIALFVTVKIGGAEWTTAFLNIWSEPDTVILGAVIGFHFGGATMKAVFGRQKLMPASS